MEKETDYGKVKIMDWTALKERERERTTEKTTAQ